MSRAGPLVILGLDAADPGFLLEWVGEGRLPALAAAMRRGCWGRTGGPELVAEHGVWVSLFSGVSRGRHGYHSYRQLKPGTYDIRTVTGLEVDASPFWTRLVGRDQRAVLVDVPDAKLVEGLRGIQLHHWATHSNWEPAFQAASSPPGLLEEVVREFGPRPPSFENHRSNCQQDRELHRGILEQVARKGALIRRLVAGRGFDLLVAVFAESHAAGHQFWRYRPGAGVPAGELSHGIRDVYQALDREIGLTLAELPADSRVFIVSSVGLDDDYPAGGLMQAFCRRLGYQVAAEAGDVSLQPLDLARRALPHSWRIALSRLLPRDRREQLLADQFRRGTDWRRTTAFAIPSDYTGFVRVNLKGREPLGVVAPGAEHDALLERLRNDLALLRDAETGEPAVARAVRATELFGVRASSALPDLFVEWRPGRFLRRVLHPRAELEQDRPDFYRVSDHSSEGFFAAAGPGIPAAGQLQGVSVLDFAPTFLTLLGQPIPPELGGKLLWDPA